MSALLKQQHTNTKSDGEGKVPGVFKRQWQSLKNQQLSQKIWLVLMIAIIPGVYSFAVQWWELYNLRLNGNPDYDWPKLTEIKTAIFTCVSCFVLRGMIMASFTPISYTILKDKFQGQERHERAQRAAQCAMKALYFMAMASFGYVSMMDADFLPPAMGGHGDISKLFDGYPYMNQDSYQLTRGYMMIAMGYHLYSLIAHCIGPSRPDFVEFLLHHIITLLLIMCGHFLNFIPIAGMISLVHDAADVFVYLARVFVDTVYDKISLVFYVGLMIVFAYGRLYVFPVHLISNTIYFNDKTADAIPGFHFMGVILHLLLALHIYWYFLLANIGYKYAIGAGAQDIHESDEQLMKKKQKLA